MRIITDINDITQQLKDKNNTLTTAELIDQVIALQLEKIKTANNSEIPSSIGNLIKLLELRKNE